MEINESLYYILKKKIFEIGNVVYNFLLGFYMGIWRSRFLFYNFFGSFSCSVNFLIDF